MRKQRERAGTEPRCAIDSVGHTSAWSRLTSDTAMKENDEKVRRARRLEMRQFMASPATRESPSNCWSHR